MSIDIDPNTEKALKEAASHRNVSIDALLKEFVDKETLYWQERKEDLKTVEEMKLGDFISQHEMFAKMDRLAKEAKLLSKDID